jgi:hypothetical protein
MTPTDIPPLAIEGTRKRPRIDTTRRDEGRQKFKKEQHPFKQVRFAAISSGQIKTLSIPADTSHTDLNKKDLWWTRAERSEICEACRTTVKEYRDQHPTEVKHLIRVFDQCSQTPSASTSEYLEQATACVPPMVRGLEWGIVPISKIYRRTHTNQVLDAQDRIRGLLNTEMHSALLSTRAIRSSRPSRVMARLLGEGDFANVFLQEGDIMPGDDTEPSDLHLCTHHI